jgi:hypothetical protein
MEERHTRERAYLLRLWQEGENAPWRASLLVTETGARRAFGSLESLFAFLRALTRVDAADEEVEHA